MNDDHPPKSPSDPSLGDGVSQAPLGRRIREIAFGKPRDLGDANLAHQIALVPFLAWVGLGADGLSSSSYGPEEAYKTLGEHTFLAIGLVALTAITVFLISAAYSRIIEQFPHGGGGYVVATSLLGPSAGVISGCALLVDYVLTITTSLAAAGDALFSLAPGLVGIKLPVEIGLVIGLTVLNIRGVKESVIALMPVFLLFLVTHLLLIVGGILVHVPEMAQTASHAQEGYHHAVNTLGIGGMLLLFVHAYSLGGGTYTGIEAVSNGVPIMREPRVATAKRTMVYMAASLAFTAAGLLLCYLLWRVEPVPGKTLNAVLTERLTQGIPGARFLVVITLFAEGALLVVAAQAGFLDGPRVLSNMAVDSWAPHRFAALSDRLTTQNGIVLMGAASLAALLYTRGDVGHLVVMYSINVFLTFSLSMFGMTRYWLGQRGAPRRGRRLALFGAALALCVTILVITVFEKFLQGGWVTLVVTAVLVYLCFRIRRHYRESEAYMERLLGEIGDLPKSSNPATQPPDPKQPVAAILVGSYGGLGLHTVLNVFRSFPGHFKSVIFLSVGVVDSGEFKGENAVEHLREKTQEMLGRYVEVSQGLGMPAASVFAIGTEAVDVAEQLCLQVAKDYPRVTFFGGKLIFQRERWYHRLLHNETALSLQKRLHWAGKTMVTLPARVLET